MGEQLLDMKKNRFISLVVLVAGLQLGAIPQQQTPKVSIGERHYLNAKRLIENNCIDCMGSTRAGMEQGIQEMQAALSSGFTNRKAAYKLLADGYNALTTFSGNDERERETFEQKEAEALREVFRMDPKDSEFATRYAATLKDEQEKVTILKSVAERDPSQTNAAFGAGMLLLSSNKPDEGIQFIRKAIANQRDPEAVMNYAGRTLDALEERNCPLSSSKEWKERFGQAVDKATRGAGDPTALQEVTKQFLEQLEKHSCKTNP
jgi:tetratricopeptide (TPR) repeat protein